MKKRNTEKNVREWAYEALLAVERDGMQSHLVIRDVLRKMDARTEAKKAAGNAGSGGRDRAFFVRLVEGTIEYRLQLDYVIDIFSKTKTKNMRPGIREILRMAVYQILYMDSVPDRAAVSEAVHLAIQKGFAGLRGFVNGVLRTVARERNELIPCSSETGERLPDAFSQNPWPDRRKDPIRALSVQYSISEEILRAWIARYGVETAEDICRAFLEDRPLTVHHYCFAASQEQGETAVVQGRVLTPTGILSGSFFLQRGMDPSQLEDFRSGALYVQDLSSQIAVAAADIQTGDRVLDMCAAPGGKSLLAAERGAKVLAHDLTEEKVALVRENAARMRAETEPPTPEIRAETADACVFDPKMEKRFDVVIADLPCSGFGVAGRKPEVKYKPYRETVTALAGRQREILTNAARYVRPGGKLLYSTCTIAVEENEDNVCWLLENTDLRRTEMSESVQRLLRTCGIPDGKLGVQLLPCDGPWDGFFFALFQREAAEE